MDNIIFNKYKNMNGYKFKLLHEFDVIKKGLKNNTLNCDVLAVLKLPCIDIEWTLRDYDPIRKSFIHDYFCCVKDESGWHSEDEVDFGEKTPEQFSSKEELEKDMLIQLLKHAKEFNLKLT